MKKVIIAALTLMLFTQVSIAATQSIATPGNVTKTAVLLQQEPKKEQPKKHHSKKNHSKKHHSKKHHSTKKAK